MDVNTADKNPKAVRNAIIWALFGGLLIGGLERYWLEKLLVIASVGFVGYSMPKLIPVNAQKPYGDKYVPWSAQWLSAQVVMGFLMGIALSPADKIGYALLGAVSMGILYWAAHKLQMVMVRLSRE